MLAVLLFLLWEKVKIFDLFFFFFFFLTSDKNKTFCAYMVATNGFTLNRDQRLQIYDFLKDVESTFLHDAG